MYLSRFFEKNARGNASLITVQLLRRLKVPVTSTVVTDRIENHPDYPSLFSISQSLDNWKVENIALQVEPEMLDKLPVPFIAHTGKEIGKFILVNSVSGAVNYLDENGKSRSAKREEFVSNWSGHVLLAEAASDSGQKDYIKERKREILDKLRMPAILLASTGLILLYYLCNTSATVWGLLFQMIKLTGVAVTSLILLYELDSFNPLVKQICQAGKKLNCKAVLGSKHAKLFNLVGWGEIGFFYFAAGFLYLLLGQGSQLMLLSWLNIIVLPYIIFSVLYQWRVVKQWCPLCLTVQVLLALEGILCYFNYWRVSPSGSFSFTELVPLITSFLLPLFFWVATKKVYIKAMRGEQYQKEAAQLKYNKEVFYSLLSNQKMILSPADGLGITIGNPLAKNTIIKVCNPYCGPCSKAHPIIDELLEENDDLKVQIIFTATNEENNMAAKPVRHLMALYEKGDKQLTYRALNDWYNQNKKNYDVFANKYFLNGEVEKQGEKLEKMSTWCKEIQITFTPTFFINGYQLPKIYRIEDVKHLL